MWLPYIFLLSLLSTRCGAVLQIVPHPTCSLENKLVALAIQFVRAEFKNTNVNIIYNDRNGNCEHLQHQFYSDLWEITTGTTTFYDPNVNHTQSYDDHQLIGFHLHQFTTWTELNFILFYDGSFALDTVRSITILHHFQRENSFNIFWQVANRDEALLEVLELERLKYKVELIPSLIDHVPPEKRIQVEFWSRCFYCNDGGPFTQFLLAVEVTTTGVQVCPRKQALFKDYTKDFFGRVLQVAVAKGMPDMMSFKTLPQGKIVVTGGFQGKLFQLVRRKLNFDYNVTLQDSFGVQGADGVYTGMVGAVQTGEADLGIGATVTLGRHRVIHFLTPDTFELVTFVTGNPHPRPEWQMIFRAFTLPVWFTVASIAVFLVYPTFVALNALAESDQRPKLFKIGVNGLGFLFRSIFDQHWGKDRYLQYSAMRILAGAWLISGVFIGMEFRANLMKLAVSPPLEPIPSSFTQLANSDYDIYTHQAGGSLNRILSTTHTPTFHKISQKMRPQKSIKKCMEEVVKSHAACIAYEDDAIIEGQRNFADPYGHLYIHKAQMSAFNFYASIILPKEAVYIEAMEGTVSQIVDMGIVKRFHDEHYSRYEMKGRRWARQRREQLPPYLYSHHHYEKLRLCHFLGPFTVLATGFFAAFISRIIESQNLFRPAKVAHVHLEETPTEVDAKDRVIISGRSSQREEDEPTASIPYLLDD